MAVRDVVMVGILLFLIGTGLFVVYFIVDEFASQMVSAPVVNESSAAVESFQSLKTLIARFDYIVFGVFIGLVLGVIITGWFVGGYPLFMFIYFFIVVIGVVLASILANVWEDVSQASVFGTTVSSFPITNHLLNNLPVYLSVIGFVGIVVMFAKPYFLGDGGGMG